MIALENKQQQTMGHEARYLNPQKDTFFESAESVAIIEAAKKKKSSDGSRQLSLRQDVICVWLSLLPLR